MERPTWDEYFMKITYEVAKRSTCLRRQVGAILVMDKRILATGYNGAPQGLRHCSEAGCLRDAAKAPSGQRHELCRGLHAEMNALLQAASYGVRISDADLYTTTFPCSLCAKMLINVRVQRLIVSGKDEAEYPDDLAKEMFKEADTKVDLISL